MDYEGTTVPIIADENGYPITVGHISDEGALKLGKAMWWMLARIAGWDGLETSEITYVTSITVTGTGSATTISTNDGTLQMVADILPIDATYQSVTWSRTNGTGSATISSSGLLTAVSEGTVTVRATAVDGSGVYGEEVITISNQEAPTGRRFMMVNGKLNLNYYKR
jgi:uncharacterized protein YjdB